MAGVDRIARGGVEPDSSLLRGQLKGCAGCACAHYCWCNISKDFSASVRAQPPSHSPVSSTLEGTVPLPARTALRPKTTVPPTELSVGVLLLPRGARHSHHFLGPHHSSSHTLTRSPHSAGTRHRSSVNCQRYTRCIDLFLQPCANVRIRHLHLHLPLTPTSGAPQQLPKAHYPGRICACTSLQEIHLSAVRLTS